LGWNGIRYLRDLKDPIKLEEFLFVWDWYLEEVLSE
jgi:hypothetical protein